MSAQQVVITVDGLSASGKTTIAKLLAERLGYVHLNTGTLYRTAALISLNQLKSLADESQVARLLTAVNFQFTGSAGESAELLVDGATYPGDIKEPRVSEATSIISAYPSVRTLLLDVQRGACQGSNIVAEGRDMGTVVFPGAPIKFFIDADAGVRAERRLAQLAAQGGIAREQLREELRREICERDKRDTERSTSPTRPAPDAIRIDNSTAPLTVILQSMYDAVLKRGIAK